VDAARLPQETYGQQNQVLRNLGDGTFSDVTAGAGSGMKLVQSSRGVAFGDYDDDGRTDAVVVNMDEGVALLHNATRNSPPLADGAARSAHARTVTGSARGSASGPAAGSRSGR
jgi:hypothetical protein